MYCILYVYVCLCIMCGLQCVKIEDKENGQRYTKQSICVQPGYIIYLWPTTTDPVYMYSKGRRQSPKDYRTFK